jgi:hypothetical protein
MMKDNDSEMRREEKAPEGEKLLQRRDFLIGLKKWSKIVVGGALLSGALTGPEESAGAWVNRWGGGGSWGNGGGGWGNRGGSWGNSGGWNNGGGWSNRGGSWGNGSGGWGNGGGGWGNGGGGAWVNRW